MIYRTAAGSIVEVSGRYNGIHDITFDWFEEGACCEAYPVAELSSKDEPMLTWSCGCCGSGAVRLTAETPMESAVLVALTAWRDGIGLDEAMGALERAVGVAGRPATSSELGHG